MGYIITPWELSPCLFLSDHDSHSFMLISLVSPTIFFEMFYIVLFLLKPHFIYSFWLYMMLKILQYLNLLDARFELQTISFQNQFNILYDKILILTSQFYNMNCNKTRQEVGNNLSWSEIELWQNKFKTALTFSATE